jgi:hypothetical protein
MASTCHQTAGVRLGAMPIEAAKASDIAKPGRSLHSQISEKEMLDHLAVAGNSEVPVIDAETGQMIGVIVNRKSG